MRNPAIHKDSPAGSLVAEALDAVTAVDTLLNPDTASDGSGVTMRDLYLYASDPAAALPPEFSSAVANDAALSRALEHLLQTTSVHHFALAAAASSGGLLDRRNTAGASLTFRASKADETQIYVILELDDAASAPALLFAKGPDGQVHREALPEPMEGRMQLLMDAESDMVQGLRNVDWVVYVK